MKTVVRNLLAPASCVFVAFTLQGRRYVFFDFFNSNLASKRRNFIQNSFFLRKKRAIVFFRGCKDEEETPPEDTVTPAAQIELKKKQAEQAYQERLKQSGDIFDDFMKTYVSAEQEFGKAQS